MRPPTTAPERGIEAWNFRGMQRTHGSRKVGSPTGIAVLNPPPDVVGSLCHHENAYSRRGSFQIGFPSPRHGYQIELDALKNAEPDTENYRSRCCANVQHALALQRWAKKSRQCSSGACPREAPPVAHRRLAAEFLRRVCRFGFED